MVTSEPTRQNNLTLLWNQLLEHNLHPEDEFEIAALLESFGWTDKRIMEEFGILNVFQLATELKLLFQSEIAVSSNSYAEKETKWSAFFRYFREFMRGMIFALPMGISVLAMLSLRFSLWSYVNLSTRTATSIAIGTILSFMTAGGFMQSMAKQGYFYIFQDSFRMLRKMVFRLIIVGAIVTVLVSLVGMVLDILYPELPYDMLLIALLFYIVLNTLWLSVAVLYIIRKELWFTLLLVIGIALVYVGFRLVHMNIIVAQLIAMMIVVLLSLFLLRSFLKRAEKEKDRGINPRLPKASVTVYNSAPFFLYGFFYFTLLFMDRVMAWSDNSGIVPFVIWFRGDYELGLDFALIALTIPMGISEIIVSRLMNTVWSSQKDYLAKQYQKMNNNFTLQYRRNIIQMAMVTLINSVVVYFSIHWIFSRHFLFLAGRVQIDSITNQVFLIALIAYSFLSIGLLHSVVLFSLSRADLVMRPIMLAVVVDLVVGFLLSRWFSYPEAVWGLVAGCVTFLVLTSRHAYNVLHHLDYHMYYLS